MPDEPENLLLAYMRRLDAKMDRVIDGIIDMKARLTAVVRLTHRVVRLVARLDRIERRLDLVEVAH